MAGRGHVNRLRGDTNLGVVQARTVTGGIHFHGITSPQRQVVPRQLPASPGRLVPRLHELRLLGLAIDAPAPAVCVEGPGGVGKTSLALDWLHRNPGRFPDGELFADLHGFDATGSPSPATSVLHTFLLALGVAPDAVPTDLDGRVALYRTLVADRHIAVVLDNAADTDQVVSLLPGSGTCRALVTSRNHLSGLVMLGAEAVSLGMMTTPQARRLLRRRLGRRRLGAEPDAVTTILDSCCGLPLALAIVAARIAPGQELGAIAAELADTATRLDALDGGESTSNLRAVISWSVSDLDDGLRDVFWQLGIAPTPTIDRPAAASLTGLPSPRVGVSLRELVRKNLVHQRAPGRFGLHELVRLYGRELAMRDHPPAERDQALRRLVDFYLHSAFAGDRRLYPHRAPVRMDPPSEGCRPVDFVDEAAAMDWFAAEHANLVNTQRAAMERRWYRHVWLLSRALDTFHYRHGLVADNLTCSRLGAIAAEHLGDQAALAMAYRQLGRAHTRAGELADAVVCLRRALALTDAPNDRAHCQHDLARALSRQHRHPAAAASLRDAVDAYREADNPVGEAHALNALGRCEAELGHFDAARTYCEQALVLHERHDNRGGQAVTLDNLAFIATRTRRHTDAVSLFRRAVDLCHHIGDSYFEAACTERLGSVLAAEGQTTGARDAWQSAYAQYADQHRVTDAERVRLLLGQVGHTS